MRWTLASGITLARLLFVPPIILLLVSGHRAIAFGLLLIVLIGDLADGALARWRREVTELGKLLDPMVDKLIFLSVFASLAWIGDLHWISLALLSGLQLGVLVGALFWLKRRRDVPPARLLGKVASFVLSLGLLGTFLKIPYYGIVVYVGIALAYLAGLDYLVNFLRAMKAPSSRAGIRAREGR
ncbi:MAG: hypothetical protein A2Z21_03525 [Candidatus Fraserbacteria bacterium RBG_16_55_9]|uniref:CDP-diacylglycerol--glycerol-3-phosphate 3-phosphatidyltransferase n=1 Tax=Fraserbacteria sp. (strain RBG_16_55_9) TaxID=1817864 RepID=A0A1F5V0M2_FRAXR|nr:MAG: hypothetical protein A2Z21_03525 [Candidatus Fraserbacteria bacterium RBG_16_55_9]